MDAGSPVSGSGDRGEKEKAKRGYRACLHCRSRKAKCDLGDIDAPSEPPCSRCKRESRECVFAPSRRGGNNMRRKAESLGLDLGLRDEKDFMDGLHTAEGEGSSTVSGGIAGHGGRRSAISIEAYNGLEAEYHPTQRHSFSATPDRPGPHAVQDPSPFTGNIEGAAQAGNNNKGARGAHAQGGPSGLYTAQGVRISPNASAPSVLHVASARTTSANDHPSTSQGSQLQSSRSQQKSQYQPALGPIPLSDVEADNFTSASHARPRPYGSSLKDLLHSSSPQHNPYSGAGSNGAMSSLDPSPAAATGSPTTSTNHPTPHWGISTGTGTLAETGHASLVGRKGLDGRDGRESSTSPKRRRLHLNPPLHADDPSSLVVADVQNESDALHILALASGSGRGGRDGDRRGQGRHADEDLDNLTEGAALARRPGEGVGGSRGIYNQTLQTEQGGLTDDGRDEHGQASSTAYQRKGPISALLARQGADGDPLSRSRSQSKALISTRGRKSSVSRELKDYELVRKGIVPEDVACRLVDVFFRCHHHLFPMVPASLIPRTKDEIGVFANNERYLMTAIIIIASRNDMSIARVHDEAWALFRVWLSDITCLGEQPTVGLVEALLLLAENLPRDPSKDSESSHVHGAENRQSWMLIGCAIRNAYGLGIDKIASRFVPPQERTFELERARLAWTYCYLFDRHVSLRLGLAFWSRGPSTCFQGFSDSAQTGPAAAAANFPYLVENTQGPERDRQEDMAGLVQAYLELTQIMTNAHDVLYPNTARTRSLVMYGEYFKYIDELMRSLEGFKILWQHKKWNIFPLNDVLWAMYFYTQLYLCAFSFQAHVERAAMRAEEEYSAMNEQHKAAGGTGDLPRPPLSLFPRGAAASPDCRYIFQSCDAARTLLHICTDSLGPGGALPFLPSRYLLWFTYAAIVLLKALYSGAMLRADHAETLSLIDQLCVCLAGASTDDEHPAVRYGRQLEALRKKLASSTSADSQGPGSPLGIGGVTTVAPDVPASMAKAPAVSVSKKGKVLAKSRTSTKSGSSGRDNASTTAAGASRQAGKGILDSPVWTMPAAPDHSDGVSFAYPATPIDHASTSVKTEQANMTHDRDVRHADPPILSNFMMSQNAPYTAPHGQYPQFAHSQQAGSGHAIAQQQQPPGLPFIPPNTVGEGYNPFASQNAANNGLSMMPLGNMSYHAVNDHLGDNASSNFPMAFGPTQHANQQLPVQQSGQPTQHLQQPTGTMGADFEVNNLGFPQLLDDWFGPVQEEDETLGALDLQDFWMKVGPGEAQGGFPFR